MSAYKKYIKKYKLESGDPLYKNLIMGTWHYKAYVLGCKVWILKKECKELLLKNKILKAILKFFSKGK